MKVQMTTTVSFIIDVEIKNKNPMMSMMVY